MYDENSNSAGTATVAASSAIASNAVPSSTLVNQLFNVKDSRWLQVEVCREFLRGQCARTDQECKFAHPPAHVDVQQGRVTACYDSIKGRCTRENPKCKYLHPPQHIKDQLLINGRNHLAIKNMLSAQMTSGNPQIQVNPIAQIMTIQQQQQQQQVVAANMMQNIQYPYYQGPLVYSPIMQDPYSAAVAQQLQMALLSGNTNLGVPGLLQTAAVPHVTAAAALAAAAAAAVATNSPRSPATVPTSSSSAAAAAASSQQVAQHAAAAQQQQQQQIVSMLALNRKRQLKDDDATTSSQLLSLAPVGVPCKRPNIDKNGTVVYQPAQPAQQFNPYLLQTLGGYVPTVPFNGQLPPRY